MREGDGERLRACLQGGGVAIIPTDTVYGIACDPRCGKAIMRIYEAKGRPPQRPCAILFFTIEAAWGVIGELAPHQRDALLALLPGAVTVVVSNPSRRYLTACGPDPDRLGLRIPRLDGPLAQMGEVSIAVMQSSANLSGAIEARRLEDVPRSLRDLADLCLDGGELPGRPTTVIDISTSPMGRIPPGAIGSGGVLRGPVPAGVVGEIGGEADGGDECPPRWALLRDGALPVSSIQRLLGPLGWVPDHDVGGS